MQSTKAVVTGFQLNAKRMLYLQATTAEQHYSIISKKAWTICLIQNMSIYYRLISNWTTNYGRFFSNSTQHSKFFAEICSESNCIMQMFFLSKDLEIDCQFT